MTVEFKKGMSRFSKAVENRSPGFEPSLDRILALGPDLETAKRKGLFVPLPARSPRQSKDVSRIRTIRDRLYKLGYMGKKTGTPKIDDDLRQGIRRFQREAGLKEDGWAGEKETWPALQELVSFEAPTDAGKWFDRSGPRPALKRAVALRLFALGIRKTRPASENVRIKGDLRQFGIIWTALGLGGSDTPADVTPEWIDRLFDMDGLSRRLSTADWRSGSKKEQQVRRFIVSTAKIELWLHGYGVRPDGYDLKIPKRPDDGPGDLTDQDIYRRIRDPYLLHHIRTENRPFYDALHQFWTDQGKDDTAADQLSLSFSNDFQSFFKAVDAGVREEKEWDPDEAGREVENFVVSRKEDLPAIWDRVKGFGARIWDGIRRVWGWFKRILEKSVKKVLEVGLNMSRLVYDYALGAFNVISNLIKSIGATVRLLVSREMPGSDPETGRILLLRDKDADIKVFIDSRTHGPAVERSCRELTRETRKFSFGCRIIGTFAMILAGVLNTGWTGYYGLVLALVRLRRSKTRFKSLVDEYKHIFQATESVPLYV